MLVDVCVILLEMLFVNCIFGVCYFDFGVLGEVVFVGWLVVGEFIIYCVCLDDVLVVKVV